MTELNIEIARKFFVSLILDYEFDNFVSCRVLTDGYYCSSFIAPSRKAAIEKFNNTEWRLKA